MKRRTLISLVTEETASEEALRAVKEHTASGQRMTNMKWTMLHNVPLFETMHPKPHYVKENEYTYKIFLILFVIACYI